MTEACVPLYAQLSLATYSKANIVSSDIVLAKLTIASVIALANSTTCA